MITATASSLATWNVQKPKKSNVSEMHSTESIKSWFRTTSIAVTYNGKTKGDTSWKHADRSTFFFHFSVVIQCLQRRTSISSWQTILCKQIEVISTQLNWLWLSSILMMASSTNIINIWIHVSFSQCFSRIAQCQLPNILFWGEIMIIFFYFANRRDASNWICLRSIGTCQGASIESAAKRNGRNTIWKSLWWLVEIFERW